ncbi:MAG TPA: tRNA uridine-5-carboxymethylaminomethyl(34) synthesis GTPase MnmE, partial [Acidobacteriota bacterium]
METIVALATPPGRSAIAVVRISGPDTLAYLKRLAHKDSFVPRHATLVDIKDPQSCEKIDTCLVQYFPQPHSYTGEDLCEISCHGSTVLAGRLLESLLVLGARFAQPGEFTLRAFINGKMDLAQAEAVRDLVNAQTEYQARVAREQLEGKLSLSLQPLKQRLVEVISFLETAVEFVEDDVGEIPRADQSKKLSAICDELEKMEATYQFGKFIHDGFRLAIVGRPNVGKSSLFNALLESDRAIVTEIPGTTRDPITESIHVHGIPVRLTDTAGIRPSVDRVERIGIERSHQAAGEADVLLVVLDSSQTLTTEDEVLLTKLDQQRGIVVWNKMDLVEPQIADHRSQVAGRRSEVEGRRSQVADRRSQVEGRRSQVNDQELHVKAGNEGLQRSAGLRVDRSAESHYEARRGADYRLAELHVSALTGAGIDGLRQAIYDALSRDASSGQQGIIVTNLRHRDCMTRTRAAVQEGIAALRG